MDDDEETHLGGVWGGRVDSFDNQVAIMQEYWRRLAAAGPGLLDMSWYCMSDECDPGLLLDTPARLRDAMDLASFGGRSGYYTFTTRDMTDYSKTFSPSMHMRTTLGDPTGWDNGPANTVQISFEPGGNPAGPVHWPTLALLHMGVQLVKDIVDVWHPESAYLCTSSLMRAAIPGAHPIIGLVCWLADAVVDPLELPSTPIRERYADGTLIGVDPDGPDPIRAAMELASSIYDAKILKPLPIIQGQPDPD